MALQKKDHHRYIKLGCIKFDILQLVALLLVVLLATFLQASKGTDSYALISSNSSLGMPELQITLAPDQPVQIIEWHDQWVASFVLSTDSETPITINEITFWPLGNLDKKMLGYHQIYPMSVQVNGEVLGKGGGWFKEFLYIENVVSLDIPIIVSSEESVILDVYVGLPHTYRKRFGVYISNVETSLPTSVNVPVKGFLYAIRNRSRQK